MRRIVFLLVVLVCSAAVQGQEITQGSLLASGKSGDLGMCPLKTTSVKTDISGFLARVSVKQEFENSFNEPIEAVYVFPLSQKGAVDSMTMTIGDRVVRAQIMKRDDARRVYDTAKAAGKTAGLLDQERPNIFTQSVANIMPGESVVIEISYVETLKYEDGAYEFVFPMTVGPRYVPAGVTDANRISPPVAATRSGADISVEVNVNAGVPVEEIRSGSHEIDQLNFAPSTARVTLRGEKTIPNKDFILRYDVTGKRIEDALLTHRADRGGFFTLMLQPPDKVAAEDRTPKEIVFVLDTSGSMYGFPIEKAKEAMSLSLEGLHPEDTFNVITFAGDTAVLFESPVPATRANLDAAQQFISARQGAGGTEMMKAIKAALAPSDSASHLRIVCFMTDGYIGNEDDILAEIRRHPNARVFSFGIGSSVNRFLLDKIASEGKGEAEYVALEDDGSKAAKRFYERVRTPMLTDLSIDWNGMPIADVYPSRLSDLFSAKPVIVHGRYTKAGEGTITLKGKVAGQPYERNITVNMPEREPANDVLATLWARTRIDDISSARLTAATPAKGAELDQQITNLGLEFRLLTKFTSFVAVEDRIVNPNGTPATVEVPAVLPEGMSPENATPGESVPNDSRWGKGSRRYSSGAGSGMGTGHGSGRGTGDGSGRGSGSGRAAPPPPPARPAVSTISGGGGAVGAEVTVTAEADQSIDVTDTSVQTTVTSQGGDPLPKSVNFSSVLKITPSTAPAPRGGAFQIDGASGSENTFIIDGQEVTTGKTKERRSQYDGRILSAPTPVYPETALAAKARGKVEVDIQIDAEGNVVSATPHSGSELLWDAAKSAALLSKFRKTNVNGRNVKVSGTIIYNFRSAKDVQIFVSKMKIEPPTADEMRSYRANAKLHFWLSDAVARLKSGTSQPTPNEAMFVKDGMAEVHIELSTRSPAVLLKLTSAGFELQKETGKAGVTGLVALDALTTLTDLPEVKLILPKAN